jgi:hypothetical protein
MSRVPHRQTTRTPKRAAHPALSKRRLDELVEEAIVDAYGESEQCVGLLTMLEEHLAVPFTTEILGTSVRVERVDLNDADEIVAICRRGNQRQKIPILDLPLPSPPPPGGNGLRPIATGHVAEGSRSPTIVDQNPSHLSCAIGMVFVGRIR